MKNLFKNTLRSLPKNKLNIVSLVFLIFLCLSVFCTMSNTFSNITTQYDSIVKNGNLHDIVISEQYDIGEPSYEITNPEWIYLADIKIEEKSIWDIIWSSFEPNEDVNAKNIIPLFLYKEKNEIDFPIFWESSIEVPIHLNNSNKKIEKTITDYFKENKQQLIPFYLSQLYDENYYDWDRFIEQFNDDGWKEKNKNIISILANIFDCSIDQINREKINSLENEIKNNTINLLDEQKKLFDGTNENKKELIPFYLSQLYDENYYDWDRFIEQFNDDGWKNNDKNKPIIDNLASLLDCSSEQINREKINSLKKEIKNNTINLLDEQKNFLNSLNDHLCYCCINKNPWFYWNDKSKNDEEEIKRNIKSPFFVLPDVIIENGKIIGFKYNFKLSNNSTGLFELIAENAINDVVNFEIFIPRNEENNKDFEWIDEKFVTPSNNKNAFKWKDYFNNENATQNTEVLLKKITDFCNEQISNKLQEQKKYFINNLNPLKHKLKQYCHNNKLKYKNFSSFTIDSADSLMKIINSNPTDEIDKIVLFPDQNKNRGYGLFSCDDYAPNGANLVFFNLEGEKYDSSKKNIVGRFIVPQTTNDLFKIKLVDLDSFVDNEEKFLYAQIIQKRFKWICNGNFTYSNKEQVEEGKKIYDCVFNLGKLASNDHKQYYNLLFQQDNQQLRQEYEKYKKEFYHYEFVNFNSVFLTIEWNPLRSKIASDKTNILSSEIHNLFDLFTVLNPEYMKQNNKEVISTTMMTSFTPFVEWFKLTYPNKNINVDKEIIVAWLNWITYDEYQYWLKGGGYKKFILPKNINGKNQEIECKNWKGIEKKYIYNCSNYDLIIIGCGITPDFIYPSISLTKLISNPKKDCLVYLNDGGFKQLQLPHVNAPIENFVVCKFNENISFNERKKIVDDLNAWSRKNMIFPDGINNVFFNNNANNQLNANTFRISYLPNIIKLFKIISYVICAFIFLLAIIICIIIIKYYVNANKVNIGILLANGVKKSKIIISLLPFVWIPSIIGGGGAYLLGLFMQVVGLKLFKNYWFLPTKLISFNYIIMLLCIFFPFIIFSLTSFFSTLKMLNSKLTFLLNKQSDFKGSLFSRIAKIPFAHFGIMTRFRIASAFGSFWRLLILSITISIAMSGAVFSVATLGKIDESNKTNVEQFSYKHAIELVTPTANGGNYNAFNFKNDEQTGFFQTNSTNYIFNTTINQQDDKNYYPELTKPYYSINLNDRYKKNQIMGNWFRQKANSYVDDKSSKCFWSYSSPLKYHELIGANKNLSTTSIGTLSLFNEGDDEGKDNDLFYMQNKSLSKLALEHDFGIPSLQSANPWRIAISMMPLNYQNLANKSLENLIQKAGEKIYDPKNQNINSKWYKKWELSENVEKPKDVEDNAYKYFIIKESSNKYKLSPENAHFTVTSIGYSKASSKLAINPYFIELLKTIYSDPELASNEFAINYGSIPLNVNNNDKNNEDETYTYIEGYIDNNLNKIKILAPQRGSKYVNIVDNNKNNLLEKLYSYKQKEDDIYPIVINSYVAFKNKLKIGDKFKFNPENCVDRFLPQQKKEKNNCIFEIIAIAKSTANELFFTTQYFANKILGLPDGINWNKTHKYMLWTNDNDREQWQNKSMIVDLATNSEYLDIYSFKQEQGKFEKIDTNKNEKYRNKHIGNVPTGFNGIFTKTNIDDSYLKSLSLYSLSGLYPGTSTFVSENNNENKFTKILSEQTGHNLALANFITGLDNEKVIETIKNKNMDMKIINDFCEQLANIYGKTTSITTIKTADDLTTMKTIINGLIHLFNLIQCIIISVFFPIAILIVMVISSLLIKQNQKYAIMLKSLGYSDLQNTKNILSLYIPISIIGIFLSIPFTMLLATSYQMLILKSVKILIYTLPSVFHYLIGSGLIFVILFTCALYGYHSLKKVKLNKEIKS